MQGRELYVPYHYHDKGHMRYSREIPLPHGVQANYASMQQGLLKLTAAEVASGKKVPTFFDEDIQYAGFLDVLHAEGQRAMDLVFVAKNFHTAYRHKFPSPLYAGTGKAGLDETLKKVEEALQRLGASHLLNEPTVEA